LRSPFCKGPYSRDPYGSKAEIQILKELQRRGLYPVYQRPIVLKAACPDYVWALPPLRKFSWAPIRMLCIFLDGEQVHCDLNGDFDIQRALEDRGHRVVRIRYKAPLSKAKVREITDQIEQTYRYEMKEADLK